MTITTWLAVIIVGVMIWALIARHETRFVLITAGLALTLLAWNPMVALDAFAKAMISPGLVEAICSAMGFAFVLTYTRCDEHLITLLAKPLARMGLLMIPVGAALTAFINTAIPSAAGCAAAVGSTMIPLMMRTGIRPAGAAATVLVGTYGSMLSPGLSHNAFVAKLAKMDIMSLIQLHAPYSLMVIGIGVVGVTIVTFAMGDHRGGAADVAGAERKADAIVRPNLLYAIVPFVPLTLLILGNTVVPVLKMGVAQAMVIGAIVALLLTRTSPSKLTTEFFNGMGKGYGDIIGIIIAAGVFAAGLKAAGLIDVLINGLKQSNEFARWGGSLGPFLMAVFSGSGDAAALAFNEAVTPHAAQFGMKIPQLGMLSAISGGLGRTMSPIAGVVIVVSGLAMVSPLEVVRRTAPAMIVAVIVLALVMV